MASVLTCTLSFIIPAFNEASGIRRTLESVFKSARAVAETFEVIVVNDGSTDETAAIARDAGARVIDVNLRKISAVRNAGARVANGRYFVFVDADTQISEPTLRAALGALNAGAAGGGAWVYFSEPMGWFVTMTIPIFNFLYMGIARWAAGCFVFARRDAFEAANGFDEKLYACEEILLSIALKRQGRFVVLHQSVATSGRKMRTYSIATILKLLGRFLIRGPKAFQTRQGLGWWYDGKRE